ncbi:CBY1-interacting BAR domain-containing protein 1-like isoform X2 [Eriocheir sinensis]|uniref:CBY1-interacting BAR domain-containing protein 1-like isoform X2 n=1 Tax=Eriocheir sinensis TaxID=95602 RepID=UPI0021C97393|nr:CBY1-interacting BAR domain-containing protein 1-like isoform X2 [Eriocheir sinensis]
MRPAGTGQMKFMQERVAGVEKHFGHICSALGAYTRKEAKLRDKGDEVSRALQDYGEEESLNKSLRAALCETADTLAAVQDYRDVKVERLEARVVGEVAMYGGVCRTARDELKRGFDTRQREIAHRRSLEKVKTRHPQNRQQIIIAETKLQKATAEAQRACHNLEDMTDQFEQKKISDLKKILKEFVQNEIAFHAKALELYTRAYNQVSSIEEDEDLEAFRNARDVFDAEFRNALKGNAVGRVEAVGAGEGSSLSPVIVTSRRNRLPRKKGELKKSMEKLQVEDYEEIHQSTSSEDD